MRPQDYEMYRNEVEVLKLCQHPNIVQLYDVVESLDNIFIVMELMKCGTLRDYIKKHGGKLPEEQGRKVIGDVAKGLQYLKELSIVHRDLKPINILMDENNNAKLADFGLALILSPNQKAKKYAGTLDFSAPEMILGLPYAHEADVWGLGVVLYYMLTGLLPFTYKKDSETKQYSLSLCLEPF